jgi:hypothetical protein
MNRIVSSSKCVRERRGARCPVEPLGRRRVAALLRLDGGRRGDRIGLPAPKLGHQPALREPINGDAAGAPPNASVIAVQPTGRRPRRWQNSA